MRMKWLAFVAPLLLSATAFAQRPVKKPACDRTCLQGYMDRYLTAMLNRDVSDALFGRNVRFTKNEIELPLRQGRPLVGHVDVPDIETQQVAMIGTVAGAPINSQSARKFRVFAK